MDLLIFCVFALEILGIVFRVLSGDGSVEFSFLGSIQSLFLSFLELFKLRFIWCFMTYIFIALVLTPLIVVRVEVFILGCF